MENIRSPCFGFWKVGAGSLVCGESPVESQLEINTNHEQDVDVEGGYVYNRQPTIRSNHFGVGFIHVQNSRGGC